MAVGAAAIGFLREQGWNSTFIRSFAAVAISTAVYHVFGHFWTSLHTPQTFIDLFDAGFFAYLIGNGIEIILAACMLWFIGKQT
ncbi:biotin transporter BioY [bacterium]|nr:biotin transporter BioY [bacterium]